MTLCVAAKVKDRIEGEDCVVCCFDFRVETATASSNTGYKFRKIGKDWAALLAGQTSSADRLLDLFNRDFNKDIHPDDAIQEIRKVLADYRMELVEEYIQSVVSLTYEDFLDRKESFPNDLFTQTMQQVFQIRPECELILFCPSYTTHFLYHVSAEGLVHQVRNFCAIGTGAPNAEAWLHFREQSSFDPLGKTLLSVYEAKKFAEHAPGVGRTTRLAIVRKDSICLYMHADKADELWAKYGPQKLPVSWPTPSNIFLKEDFHEEKWENLKT